MVNILQDVYGVDGEKIKRLVPLPLYWAHFLCSVEPLLVHIFFLNSFQTKRKKNYNI